MRDNMDARLSSDFGTEWRGMAQDVLRNSELCEHPALGRLQLHAQQDSQDEMDVGCYTKMHHRHNRT